MFSRGSGAIVCKNTEGCTHFSLYNSAGVDASGASSGYIKCYRGYSAANPIDLFLSEAESTISAPPNTIYWTICDGWARIVK